MPNLLEKCALIARAVGLNQTQLGVLLEEQGVAGVLAASNAMMGIVPPANATLPSMAAALAGEIGLNFGAPGAAAPTEQPQKEGGAYTCTCMCTCKRCARAHSMPSMPVCRAL